MSCVTNMATLKIKWPIQTDLNIVNICVSPFKALHTTFHLMYKYKIIAWIIIVILLLNTLHVKALLGWYEAILNSYGLIKYVFIIKLRTNPLLQKFQLIEPVIKIGIIDDKTRTTAADMVPNIDENTFPNVDAHSIIPDEWKS